MHVLLDGAFGNCELPRDSSIVIAPLDQLEHFELPPGEPKLGGINYTVPCFSI